MPETLGADDLLAAMRRRGVREAIVIDEYGGTAGLVTFESLMERIVGDLGGASAAPDRIAVHAGRLGRHRRPDAGHRRQRAVRAAHRRRHLHDVGGYVLGRLGRRARVGDVIEVEAAG